MPSYDNHKTVIFQINNIAVVRYYDYSHHCFKWTFENYGGPTSNLNYDELLDLISVLRREDEFLMNYMIDREKRIEYEEPTKPSMSIDQTIPSTYTVLVEKTGEESFVATCLDLQGVFANGNNEEDVMKRIRIVIKEMLQVLGNPNKS